LKQQVNRRRQAEGKQIKDKEKERIQMQELIVDKEDKEICV